MMSKLLIATTNPGKFAEMQEILADLELELVFLGDLDVDTDLEENGETFEENALLKAEHFAGLTGLPALADDSGILVDALPGELGVKTRRWGAGAEATDQEWIEYFLERMVDVEEENRGAEFVAAVALVWGDEKSGFEKKFFLGETKGVITKNLEAEIVPGIPLSSCFRHQGSDRVYSALSEAEKNAASHRGKAMKQMKKFLKTQL